VCCVLLQKLMDLAKKPLSVQETWETRYEQLMEQFASDMRLYMGMVRWSAQLAACCLPSVDVGSFACGCMTINHPAVGQVFPEVACATGQGTPSHLLAVVVSSDGT